MGDTGHLEVIQRAFDPAEISYSELLDVSWRQIDPTDTMNRFSLAPGRLPAESL